MSKILNIADGDYTIKVQSGGQITLNTGEEEGLVRITGNLTVDGTQTIVNTETMEIEDNIIVLNKNETGNGITAGDETSGIQIERGNYSDVFFVYDENLTDPNPSSQGTPGLFSAKIDGGVAKGIAASSISTGGNGDLYLIGSTGAGKVFVPPNYETGLTNDRHVTNKKYVDDAISTAFATVFLKQIGSGTVTPTSVVVQDSEPSPVGDGVAQSNIAITVDGNQITTIYEDRWEFEEIRIIGNKIETTASNTDLVLASPGAGSVVVEDTLEIKVDPHIDISSVIEPIGAVKVAASTEGPGRTGLFVVTENNTRDEIVSKNRSLLFSMLF
jgi:hypothetical protein